MKSTFFVAALAGTASAYPGSAMKDLVSAVAKRQGWEGSSELWGEWSSASDLSSTGKEIKKILQGGGNGQSKEGYKAPPMDSEECKKDTCCIWKYISAELYEMMSDGKGCNDFARSAIRMGFHDAAAWDVDSSWGGADGSLLLSDELTRFENGGGMVDQAPTMKGIFEKYKGYGISMADLLQCGAKVGALACPGGPRIRMFVGRPDDSTAAPTGKLPSPVGEADDLIALFAKKTVSPGGLIALLGAHTASRNHVAFLGALNPQDKTPGKWDTEFFKETLQANASEGVTRFISDTNLAADPITKPSFLAFKDSKALWNDAYAREYIRMSLFGVKNINKLYECTKAMPKGDIKDDPKPPYSSTKTTKTSKPTDYPTNTKTHKPTGHTKPTHYPTNTKTHKPTGHTKPTHKPTYSTSTIYSSKTLTIYSCPPEKKDCPYGPKNPLTTYTVYPVSTTVYEVTPTAYPEDEEYDSADYSVSPDYPVSSSYPEAPSYSVSPEYSASSSAPEATKKPVAVTAGAARATGGLVAILAGLVAAFL